MHSALEAVRILESAAINNDRKKYFHMADDLSTASLPQYSVPGPQVVGSTKYQQLLAVIEELGKDIRPTYTGNKICAERLKRSIVHARILVRECLLEADKDRQKAAAEAVAKNQ